MKYETATAIDLARRSPLWKIRSYAVVSPWKRVIDIVCSVLLIAMVAPLMVAIIVLTWAVDGAPILFRHTRVGRDGKLFECLKFRSMVNDPEKRLSEHLAADPSARMEWDATRKLKSDPRIIPVLGEFLRKTSLDELPQLFNVLKGDMSLVGPRPITMEELPLYGHSAEYYLQARPGLTGRWQISGRNNIGFAERVKLDHEYVRHGSLGTDIFILLQTPVAVLRQRGAY